MTKTSKKSESLDGGQKKFERLLFDLSANFIDVPAKKIDPEIEHGLRLLGEFLKIDRLTLTQFENDRQLLVSTHFYNRPGIPKPPIHIVNTHIPWFFSRIIKDQITVLERIPDDFPKGTDLEIKYTKAAGVKSGLVIPLRVGNTILGGLFFVSLTRPLSLPPKLVKQLRLSSDILAKALWRKNAWKRIEQHIHFEQMLSEISAMFINISGEALGDKINDSLKMIGRYLDADICTLQQLDDANAAYEVTHYWKNEAADIPNVLQFTPENIPWLFNEWLKGEASFFSNIDEMPEQAAKDHRTLQDIGIQSFISVPVSVRGSMLGTILLGSIRSSRNWPSELIRQLRIIGEVFFNSFLRNKAENNLRVSMEEVKQLKKQLEADYSYLREEIKLVHNFEDIIGNSDILRNTLLKVEQVAKTEVSVLISGETGTGKELIARAIHNASNRRDRPMIKVNCATLPSNLIESELFGHEKGAFSGALSRRVGRFELANGASLFLDEVGELPLDLQPKLLRVIQNGEFERLGSSQTQKTDVRIIAATNRDLESEVKQGRFRQDLWYRLNVFPINVAPLRERKEDIALLVNWFVKKHSKKIGKEISRIPTKTIRNLQDYDWPGNVRELENLIERAIITSHGKSLVVEMPLPKDIAIKSDRSLEEMESMFIRDLLEKTKWVIEGKNGAANRLGLKPSTLRNRMKKLGIKRP